MKKLKELFIFLEADMPSKIFPEEEIEGEMWARDDPFKNIKQVGRYLEDHFIFAFPELKETYKN